MPSFDPVVQERRARAMQMRVQGYSYKQISKRVGVSVSQVARYVRQSCEAMAREEYTATAELRAITASAYDTLMAAWFERGLEDKNAAEIVMRCLDSRRKIFGLDAAEAIDLSVSDESPAIEVVFVDSASMGGGDVDEDLPLLEGDVD